jgi:glycolate oxidase
MGNEILECAITLGGGAGEYGIGTARRALVHSQRSDVDREIFWRLKRALDPDIILNPEKCLPFGMSEAA